MKNVLGPDQTVLHGINRCCGFTLFANTVYGFYFLTADDFAGDIIKIR